MTDEERAAHGARAGLGVGQEEGAAAVHEAAMGSPGPEEASRMQASGMHDRLDHARDMRNLRSRLDAAEQALHRAEAAAARAPVLQAMLKDAEQAVVQRHAVILAQAEALRAAQSSLEDAERRAGERLALANQALAASRADNQALLQERASILGSTSWKLTSVARGALSRLRGR